MNNPPFDFIIVGQGLAGSILAHTLINRGKKVMVLDNDHRTSSSRVAAGIINPITGHRLNITENFSAYFPQAQQCYQELEKTLNSSFFNSVEQQRLIKTQGQLNYFHQRIQEPDYHQTLSPRLSGSDFFKDIEFGVARIAKTTVIDTKTLLASIKQWLIGQQAYQKKEIEYTQIEWTKEYVTVHNFQCKQLIFCEGYQAINNPWLKELPFKLAKGEIITMQPSNGMPTELLNWGSWLAPQINAGTFKLGSNYDWQDLSLQPSELSSLKFIDSMSKHTNIQGDIVAHEVGIRPTTQQRKPFIGPISSLENVYCFNGFGSKGCLLIPYYAELFTKHLLENVTLPEEIQQWL